jgi:hypothetical protein
MNWLIGIIVALAIIIVAIIILLLDMKRLKDCYEKSRNNAWEDINRLQRELTEMEVHEATSLDNAPYTYTTTNMVDSKLFENLSKEMKDAKWKDEPCDDIPEKEKLEKRLADIKYAEKHPLAVVIEQSKENVIEFFVDGKSIGRYFQDDAIKYSKSHLKQGEKDWLIIQNGMFRVKKLKTKDMVA